MSLRVLTAADATLLDEFLAGHRDTSMFLRANARQEGLEYKGGPLQAVYAGAFRDGRVAGVVAHCGNGMVLVQAPEQTAELARACAEWSGRPVTGLSGPLEQVRRARSAMDLADRPAAVEGDEWLYALDLADLVVPEVLSSAGLTCRPPRPDERDLLCAWRLAYDIELLNAADVPEHRQRSARFLDAQIAAGNAWVALDHDDPVSLAAFNATLPDIVQLGGIYTPPDRRGRGYAKAAVAASLVAARARGASRAVLFTSNPNAVRTYEALGFRRIGDYALVLFR